MAGLRDLRIILVDTAKRLARPVTRHRFKIELARYRGRAIASLPDGNRLLYDSLRSGAPAAAGKIGGTELVVLNRWVARHPIEGEVVRTWRGADRQLNELSGFYPVDDALVSRFSTEFLKRLGEVDFLGAWYRFGEAAMTKQYAKQATLIDAQALEPYFGTPPWSAALEGKRVVVFSPFSQSIERQYARRHEVWAAKPDVLPDFKLITLRAPMYPQMVAPSFPTWFDALAHFQRQLDAIEYDVVITGAGAWSIPLAVHAKRTGKWGIHMGGSTQILFGIKGRRWDDNPKFQGFFNDAWIRPSPDERPSDFRGVENGCYW